MTVTLLLYCDYQDLNWSLDLISPEYLMLQNSSNDIHPTTRHLRHHLYIQLECLTMLICRDKTPSCSYIIFQIDPSPFSLL